MNWQLSKTAHPKSPRRRRGRMDNTTWGGVFEYYTPMCHTSVVKTSRPLRTLENTKVICCNFQLVQQYGERSEWWTSVTIANANANDKRDRGMRPLETWDLKSRRNKVHPWYPHIDTTSSHYGLRRVKNAVIHFSLYLPSFLVHIFHVGKFQIHAGYAMCA